MTPANDFTPRRARGYPAGAPADPYPCATNGGSTVDPRDKRFLGPAEALPEAAAPGTVTGAPSGAATTDRLPLRTPAQAAQLLAVPESWLRRKAAARVIPCTFLGKHLRFSPADLAAIAAAGAHPNRTRASTARRRLRGPRRPR